MRHIISVTTILAFFIAVTLTAINPAPANAFEVDTNLTAATTTTSWTNQSGSTMTLTLNCDDSPEDQPLVCPVSGTYVNHAANSGCQGTPYPLTGLYYEGNETISWSVAWSNDNEDCASVTGWTGYKSDSSIVTNWNLAYYSSWDGNPVIEQGEDTFTQNPGL